MVENQNRAMRIMKNWDIAKELVLSHWPDAIAIVILNIIKPHISNFLQDWMVPHGDLDIHPKLAKIWRIFPWENLLCVILPLAAGAVAEFRSVFKAVKQNNGNSLKAATYASLSTCSRTLRNLGVLLLITKWGRMYDPTIKTIAVSLPIFFDSLRHSRIRKIASIPRAIKQKTMAKRQGA